VTKQLQQSGGRGASSEQLGGHRILFLTVSSTEYLVCVWKTVDFSTGKFEGSNIWLQVTQIYKCAVDKWKNVSDRRLLTLCVYLLAVGWLAVRTAHILRCIYFVLHVPGVPVTGNGQLYRVCQ
jgi:hypothetical protein